MTRLNFEFDFNDLLSETVDEAFSALGESPKQAIFFHLEKHFRIKQQEIPIKIEAFDGAIKKFFGVGATFLETLIVRRLCEKAGLPLQESPSKDSDFVEAVVQVRQKMEK